MHAGTHLSRRGYFRLLSATSAHLMLNRHNTTKCLSESPPLWMHGYYTTLWCISYGMTWRGLNWRSTIICPGLLMTHVVRVICHNRFKRACLVLCVVFNSQKKKSAPLLAHLHLQQNSQHSQQHSNRCVTYTSIEDIPPRRLAVPTSHFRDVEPTQLRDYRSAEGYGTLRCTKKNKSLAR
jgi:hypothetical protein